MIKITKEEKINFIKFNCSNMTNKEISSILNIKENTVQRYKNEIGIKEYSHIKWTDEIIKDIIEFYPKEGVNYITDKYNLPKSAVYKKAQSLKIKSMKENKIFHHSSGYLAISIEGKAMLYHRFVYQKYYDVILSKDDIIHHIDGNKHNNEISNLKLTNRGDHLLEHQKELYIARGINT